MGNCCGVEDNFLDNNDDELKFVGGNVHLITTEDGWKGKISEAGKDGKIERDVLSMKIDIIQAQVVANFSATWCGPCRQIAPIYNELSEKFPSLMFLTIDVDALSEFSSSWDIRATPTFFFLKDGQQIDKIIGANRTELEMKVDEYAHPGSVPQ